MPRLGGRGTMGDWLFRDWESELCLGVEVGSFDVLEVAVGLHLEFVAGGVVGHDDGLGVHLQG